MSDYSTLLQQGFAAYRRGDFAAAERHCRAAIEAQPRLFDPHHMLAVIQVQLGRPQEALANCDLALSLRPDDPAALSNRAVMLNTLGRYDEAVVSCDVALSLRPNAAATLENRGIALSALKRFDEAMASYDRALGLQPEFAECRINRASLLLLRGSLSEGWREYEWRRKLATWAAPQLDGPEWRGDDLSGRRLLLYGEGWSGDTIQFARFVPLLAERAREIVVQVEPSLCGLLRRVAGASQVMPFGEPLPPYDCHLPLASLPFVLDITETQIPAAAPYLTADPGRLATWSERLPKAAFRVGIAGEVEPGRSGWRERPIPQTAFAPLGRIPGVQLIALGEQEANPESASAAGRSIIDLGVYFAAGPDQFLDLAAVMMHLDLVVTGDGVIAHLAGALGRPVSILLPDVSTWRWLLDRTDSPWYPTARLFRQSRRGDWDGVMAAAASTLTSMVGQRTGQFVTAVGLRAAATPATPATPATREDNPVDFEFNSADKADAIPGSHRIGVQKLRHRLAVRVAGACVAAVLMLAPPHSLRWTAIKTTNEATQSVVAKAATSGVTMPLRQAPATLPTQLAHRTAAAAVAVSALPSDGALSPPRAKPAGSPRSTSQAMFVGPSPARPSGKAATGASPAAAHATSAARRPMTNRASIPAAKPATGSPAAALQSPSAATRATDTLPLANHPAAAAISRPVRTVPAAAAAANSALRARGDTLFVSGDITSARLFYRQAAEAGDGQAALQLGETYDPAFLAQARLSSAQADPAAAAHWYREARTLGMANAEVLLKGLAPYMTARPSPQ
jgi:hypothetical protein